MINKMNDPKRGKIFTVTSRSDGADEDDDDAVWESHNLKTSCVLI